MLPHLLRVRFKFLLGELLVSDWRVPMIALAPSESADPSWPCHQDTLAEALPREAAGYYCQRTAVERFPLGLSRLGPWRCYVPRRERLYCVSLAGTFSEYLQRHSAKSRHNLKRSVKKLLERNPGGVLEIASEEKQMAAFHHAAVAISRRTYQERLLGAGLPNTAEYLCEMQSLARRGEARGYLLRDRGQAIAFAWCSAHGRLITYNVIGYLPECSALSPGTVLLYLILEDLFQTGIYSVLDFGVGESFYKQAFATHHIDFSTAYLFRPEWRYTWRVWLHWWLDRVSSGLGRLLDRLGLKHLVRGLVWKLWCRRRDYDAKPLNSHFRGSSVRGSQ